MQNFMLTDLLDSIRAIAIFSVFLVSPGYVAGWLTEVLGFRRRSLLEKLLISVPLSVALSPALAVLLGRYLSPNISLAFFVGVALCSLPLIGGDVRRQVTASGLKMRRSTWIALGLVFTWVIIVLVELIDIQVGHRLYMSVSTYDACDRTAFIQACLRSVPPKNPFYDIHGHAPTMRYFYTGTYSPRWSASWER